MYDREEIRIFENFLQRIIEKPRSMPDQPHTIQDGFIWCDDWRIIEILKYFINGPEMYANDPPPNRLKKNPLWNQSLIVAEAMSIKAIYQTPQGIVDHLRQERDKLYA